MNDWLTAERCLPEDHERAELIGRIWLPEAGGPALVSIRNDTLFDLSAVAATSAQLLHLRTRSRRFAAPVRCLESLRCPMSCRTARPTTGMRRGRGCWRRAICRRSRPPA